MTSTRTLRISASEVVQLLRDEMAATNGQPELDLAISKEYKRTKAPRRRTRNADKGTQFDLVNEVALLSIEPRREHDYWVLRVEVETPIGLRAPADDHGLEFSNLTMKEFDENMQSPNKKRIRLRLETETPDARFHFDQWLSQMRKHHPPLQKRRASRPTISQKPQLSTKKPSVSPSRQRKADPVHQETVRKSATLVDKLLPLARERLTVLGAREPLIQAARLLAQKEANLVVVCNSAGKMVGVVAKTDVVRAFCSGRESRDTVTISATMTRQVISCRAADVLVDVWCLMKTHGLKHIPIVDPDSRPIGLAIARDLMGLLMEEAEYEEQLLRDYVTGVGYR